MKANERIKATVFTPAMKATHTVLIPTMLPIHFELMCVVLQQDGYKVDLLKTKHRGIAEEGLKNVHNDTCYPALLVIGQLLDALKSGAYDPHTVALLITQTGGGCRASNYLALLRKALHHGGFDFVPVISLNFSGLERESSLQLSKKALVKAAFALTYGDMLMWIYNQCRVTEKEKGASLAVVKSWIDELCIQFRSPTFMQVGHNFERILADFAAIDRDDIPRISVGIVGEIYMKYSALGNNDLEEFLVSQGAQPVVSGVTDFVLYCIRNWVHDLELYGLEKSARIKWAVAGGYLQKRQQQMIDAIRAQGIFQPPTPFSALEKLVEGYIGLGAKMGEGWLLTAEMLELLHSGVRNIICTQPFGCLPNHIVAKGMIRKIRENNPSANIVAVDYDPGATAINQENRIKLLLANAFQAAGISPETLEVVAPLEISDAAEVL